MAFTFGDFSYLAEQNPAQYAELLNALQQISTKMELEAKFAESMANYADYEILPNAAGYTFINTGTRIAGAYNGPISSSTETALELATEAYDYEVIGANGQVLYRANMGAVETAAGSGTYKSVPLLSMDLGIVGAAAAPILGVSLGANLYQNNPEFWTKLSQKLLPFCYPGTTKIPGWLDVVESALHPGQYETQAVIDKNIILALQEWFQEEGWVKEIAFPVGTGSVVINSVGSLDDVLNYALHTFTHPFADPDNIFASVLVNIKAFLNAVPGRGFTIYRGFSTIASGFAFAVNVTVNSMIGATENYGSWQASSHQWIVNVNLTSEGILEVVSAQDNGSGSLQQSIGITPLQNGYCLFGGYNVSEAAELPEGTTEWNGYEPSLDTYSKPIIYMVEDPNNPGSFVVESVDGIAIAVPDASTQPGAAFQSTKPENWPEDVDWPLEIDFPWERPDGYEGDWPETMPWPLPADKPDWWPDVIPYPGPFSYPAVSNGPSEDPDPNKNADPKKTGAYVETSPPGTTIDPSEEPEPQPQPDPSIPTTTPVDVIPVDPPGTPGVPTPPVDNGESPLPITPIIPLPFTSTNDGLISVYHPTDAQLKAFSRWLWVTYADPSIDKLWNNPFDGVIGLMEIYCTPTDVGPKNIRSGFLDSGISSQTISRYTEIDCGTIYVPEYYRNYLDYSPYSKAHVYLPFIGIVELNVDDVVGHGINITYKIDEYNGACIAIITCARHHVVNGEDVDYNSVTYQFSGNCAVELPLAGGTQSAIRAGLIQAAAYGLSSVVGGIVSGVSGNIGGAVSQLGYGAANAIGSVVSAKSSVQHSGSFGSSYGALGIKVPFIIVSRPRQLQVLNYAKIYGYPAHAGVTIGSCTGYLRVREVHVKSATATDDEKKRIEELLKEGVYVTEE